MNMKLLLVAAVLLLAGTPSVEAGAKRGGHKPCGGKCVQVFDQCNTDTGNCEACGLVTGQPCCESGAIGAGCHCTAEKKVLCRPPAKKPAPVPTPAPKTPAPTPKPTAKPPAKNPTPAPKPKKGGCGGRCTQTFDQCNPAGFCEACGLASGQPCCRSGAIGSGCTCSNGVVHCGAPPKKHPPPVPPPKKHKGGCYSPPWSSEMHRYCPPAGTHLGDACRQCILTACHRNDLDRAYECKMCLRHHAYQYDCLQCVQNAPDLHRAYECKVCQSHSHLPRGCMHCAIDAHIPLHPWGYECKKCRNHQCFNCLKYHPSYDCRGHY